MYVQGLYMYMYMHKVYHLVGRYIHIPTDQIRMNTTRYNYLTQIYLPRCMYMYKAYTHTCIGASQQSEACKTLLT